MKSLLLRAAVALIALLVCVPGSALLARPAWDHAIQSGQYASPRHVEKWTEEWDPVAQRWVAVDLRETRPSRGARSARSQRDAGALARFGPFLVVNEGLAALVDTTNSQSPADFDRMIMAFPQLAVLSFVDAPGTVNDVANLKLGRRIRASGLSTYIPANGSARSGAVELFLAGKERKMEAGALFAVHAWLDNYGREPSSFAENDPVNRLYLDYYVEMGMSEADARAFYAMTNSVPHHSALWFGPDQMRRWLKSDAVNEPAERKLAQIPYRFDRLMEPVHGFHKFAIKSWEAL